MELPWRLFSAIVAIFLAVGAIPFLFSGNVHEAAEFANVFGFVNALFAALAFGGVIWAIRLQTKELELQRLEVEETRDELRRSADAQDQSRQMHFLSALLSARNHVAQGYAAAAGRETGPLKPSQMAHRRHLAELEWLLQLVDRHESNPFKLPAPATLAAHQIALLLTRAHPILRSAISHRASNHVRGLLLDMNQSLRELRWLLAGSSASPCELSLTLDHCITSAESVHSAEEFEEIARVCYEVFDSLASCSSAVLGVELPSLGPRKEVFAADKIMEASKTGKENR